MSNSVVIDIVGSNVNWARDIVTGFIYSTSIDYHINNVGMTKSVSLLMLFIDDQERF
jgi:hypothetical protein